MTNPGTPPRKTTAEVVKERVRARYGGAVADALTRAGDGWNLDTGLGRIFFYGSAARFYAPSSAERELARQAQQGTNRSLVVLAANAVLEKRLVSHRLAGGILQSAPKGDKGPLRKQSTANSKKRKKPKRPVNPPRRKREKPAPLPDPLKNLESLLSWGGFRFSLDDGKPVLENFRGHFRRVPNYGICLDAPGMNVHFLPLETVVYDLEESERQHLDRNQRRGGTARLKPGSIYERRIVSTRLKRLLGPHEAGSERTSKLAMETPLGEQVLAHLHEYTAEPFNLLLLEKGSISIRKGAARLAVVSRDRVACHGRTIHSNFLGDAAHWAEVRELLELAVEALVAPAVRTQADAAEDFIEPTLPAIQQAIGWRPPFVPLPPPRRPVAPVVRPSPRVQAGDTRRRLEQPPPGLEAELVEAVLEASHAIRFERNAAFAHPVELRTRNFRVRFDPIEGDPPRVSVPFAVEIGERPSCAGSIWLWTGDPLTLVFTESPRDTDEGRVWALVLLAFADLTVWPEDVASLARPPSRPTGRRSTPVGRSPAPRHFPEVRRARSTSRRGSLDLAALRAHMVVAHKRWLPDGWDASAEKAREAAALGIVLEPGQTWVSSHSRGGALQQLKMQSVLWEPPGVLEGLF